MRTLALLALVSALSPSHAAAAAEGAWVPQSVGTTSCATWLSNATQESYGREWIMGFWAGLNMKNASNSMVGYSTDAAGIVAEIKLACQQAPSTTVIMQAIQTYHRLESAKR